MAPGCAAGIEFAKGFSEGMDMSDSISPNSARARLVNLVIGCPRNDYSEACQLYTKRSLSLVKKHEWIMSLPDNELVDIYAKHCECLKIKDFFIQKKLEASAVSRYGEI